MKAFLFSGLLFFGATTGAYALSWTSTPPSTIFTNQSYSVGASHTRTTNTIVVWIYRNGTQVASGGNGGPGTFPITASASYSSLETSSQTISYSAQGWSITNGVFGQDASISASTSVITNHSPTAYISGSTSLTVGQGGSWPFGAADVDGNLYRWRFHASSNPNPQWSPVSGSSVSGLHSTSFAVPGFYTWVVDVEDTGGLGNYASIDVTVTAPISATFSGGPFTYNGSAKSVSVTVSPGGATYTTSGTWSATNAGNYTATVTGTGYYTGTVSYSWTINPAPATFTLSGGPFTYDGTAKSISVSPNPGGATYTTSGTSATSAGTYTATATATGNYAGAGSYTWTINRAPASFTFSGGPNFTYDGTTKSVSVSPAPAAATYATSGTWAAAATGNYTASASATGNYIGSGSYNWSINAPAPTYTLTVQNGSGGASGLTSGTARTIAANTPGTGMAFANWSQLSGPGSIANASASPTTFTLGAGDATVRANYADVQAPTVPTGLAASGTTTASFTLTWSASTDNVGVAAYEVKRDSTSLGESGSVSMNVTGLSAGVTYAMSVRARDAANNWSVWSSPLNVTTTATAPAAPTALTASNVLVTGFTANWSPPAGATSYRLDVSTSNTFSTYVAGYQDLTLGNVTSASVTGLAGGTVYYYRIRAVNAGGTSGNSNVVSVLTLPVAPVASAATNVSGTGFTANWAPVASATTYRLDVSTGSSFSTFVAGYHDRDVGNAATASVTGLTLSTAYYYRVRAVNATGSSASSNVVTLTTGASADPTELNVHLP